MKTIKIDLNNPAYRNLENYDKGKYSVDASSEKIKILKEYVDLIELEENGISYDRNKGTDILIKTLKQKNINNQVFLICFEMAKNIFEEELKETTNDLEKFINETIIS